MFGLFVVVVAGEDIILPGFHLAGNSWPASFACGSAGNLPTTGKFVLRPILPLCNARLALQKSKDEKKTMAIVYLAHAGELAQTPQDQIGAFLSWVNQTRAIR